MEPRERDMFEFETKFNSYDEMAESGFEVDNDAEFVLIYHGENGIMVASSNNIPSIADECMAVGAAICSVHRGSCDDSCDVYRLGEYYGTAEYVINAAGNGVEAMQVTFSMTA